MCLYWLGKQLQQGKERRLGLLGNKQVEAILLNIAYFANLTAYLSSAIFLGQKTYHNLIHPIKWSKDMAIFGLLHKPIQKGKKKVV